MMTRVALRYGKLSNGTLIPCSYALETADGRSILYQSDWDWPHLARNLGWHGNESRYWDEDANGLDEVLPDVIEWLDARVGNEFRVWMDPDETEGL